MSENALIVSSFRSKQLGSLFKNWEYVVISQVRMLEGLYLFEPMDMNDALDPTDELMRYMCLAGRKEIHPLLRKNCNKTLIPLSRTMCN